jgi:hypothetical protein
MTGIRIEVSAPAHPVGTTFTYRKGKQAHAAEVVGYHVEHDTDSGVTSVIYRVAYDFAGQRMVASVPRSIVDRAV